MEGRPTASRHEKGARGNLPPVVWPHGAPALGKKLIEDQVADAGDRVIMANYARLIAGGLKRLKPRDWRGTA